MQIILLSRLRLISGVLLVMLSNVLPGITIHAAVPAPEFPLKVSTNRCQLVDERGAPFLYQADTPWTIFLKLTEAEAKEYIARRKEQGFAALQVIQNSVR